MMLSPGLLASLKRSRLIVRRARATTGIGERRSRRKGSGMEFVDYRKYQPGDDVRHLDPHLYLRTGDHYVREHAVEQQLPVSIIIDGSASMKFGTPSKFDFSRGLAAALAFVGLAGGDVVEVGVHASGRLSWSPRIRGARRVPVLFDWLAGQTAHEIELIVDGDVLDSYRGAFASWQDRLRARIAAGLGRYLPVRSDANLERLLIQDWQQRGLIT
jgi:uncharacterized protein (DUF58 family)